MKKILSVTGFVFVCLWLDAQVIPSGRRVNWQQIVRKAVFVEPEKTVNILDWGGVADGQTDNSSALRKALSAFDGRAGTLFFPEGTYLFRHPVDLPDSIQIKGEGSQATRLWFNLGNEPESCIRVQGHTAGPFVSLRGGYAKGSAGVWCDSAFLFHPGDWVEITEDNGSWNTVPVSWADRSVGQMARVEKVLQDTVFFEAPLRFTCTDSLKPQMRRIEPVQNAAVSCLKIVRKDQPASGGGYNILFDYAVNSRVRGVESDSSSGSHVYIGRSANIVVRGCYFHHAFLYDGVSTHGYGVTLARHSGGCLVENNVFVHLRHAMMVKTGANGNIFAYNYSRDPYRSEAVSDLSGDISLHGHFPFANLFEGNMVQNIIIDHYWGPSGPYNTFFRNRAELWGIIMTQSDTTETSRQNFVGNECTDNSFLHGQFVLTGTGHFVYANNILGKLVTDSAGALPDSSYYLSGRPVFWDEAEPWPDIGLPHSPGTGTIPAKKRFEDGNVLTVCPQQPTGVQKYGTLQAGWKIWPNPVANVLHVDAGMVPVPHGFRVRIFDLQGRRFFEKAFRGNNAGLSLSGKLVPGFYVLEIRTEKNVFVKKIIFTP